METVKQMSSGFPHRLRFKQFNARYHLLAPARSLIRSEEKAVDDCETILDCYSSVLRALPAESLPRNTAWAHGRKHIFMSEGMRQQLETMREAKLQGAALLVQKVWRGWKVRRKLDKSKQALGLKRSQFNFLDDGRMTSTRKSRPQPITGTPPAFERSSERCDEKTIQQTCALFGLDLVKFKYAAFLNNEHNLKSLLQ